MTRTRSTGSRAAVSSSARNTHDWAHAFAIPPPQPDGKELTTVQYFDEMALSKFVHTGQKEDRGGDCTRRRRLPPPPPPRPGVPSAALAECRIA